MLELFELGKHSIFNCLFLNMLRIFENTLRIEIFLQVFNHTGEYIILKITVYYRK